MPHEGKVGQTFTLDLELEIDLSAAARSDKVADTVSYDKVVECASEAFCAQRFRLIEAAAGASPTRCSRLSARAIRARHDPQAARADRRHLQRCRRDACCASVKP